MTEFMNHSFDFFSRLITLNFYFLLNFSSSRFALVNVKFAIATIIKNFQVTLDESKTHPSLKFDVRNAIYAPRGGFWVNFKNI